VGEWQKQAALSLTYRHLSGEHAVVVNLAWIRWEFCVEDAIDGIYPVFCWVLRFLAFRVKNGPRMGR
jgi:hypothetical protein